MLTGLLKILGSNNIDHELFDVSKFTFPARNIAALSFIIACRSEVQRKRICLLGSGPLEPLELSSLELLKDSLIFAYDCDEKFVRSIRKALRSRTHRIAINKLAQDCCSVNSENYVLKDTARLNKYVLYANENGMNELVAKKRRNHQFLEIRDYKASIIEVKQVDLRFVMPAEIPHADIVFEGYMLINWEKERGPVDYVTEFLSKLSEIIHPDAWFVSATSLSYYQGKVNRCQPFLEKVVQSRMLPLGGILGRWSKQREGKITTQFVSVFASNKKIPQYDGNLSKSIKTTSEKNLVDLQVELKCQEVDLGRLLRLMVKGNVFSYWALEDKGYGVFVLDKGNFHKIANHSPFLAKYQAEKIF